MQILLCIASVLFGLLHAAAAISQMKKEKKPVHAVLMAVGSVALIAAVICNIAAQRLDLIVALSGCAAICTAAILNGIKSSRLHIRHHIIRILLSVMLIIGFAFL